MGGWRCARGLCNCVLATVMPLLATASVVGATQSTAGAVRVAAVAPSPSPGCGAGSTLRPGETTNPYRAAQETGSYLLDVPPGYSPDRPMPIVMDLHGYADPINIQAAITGLGAYGDAHGFLTLTPEVTDKVPMWNTGLLSNDVAFLGDLLTTLEHAGCVDERRVFVTGYSDGAFMTSTLACSLSSRVAAVAPVAGIQAPRGCRPVRAVPVVAFHGTADPFVPYLGGVGKATLSLPAPDGSGKTIGEELGDRASKLKLQSAPAAAAAWAHRNGCRGAPRNRRVASDVTRIMYPCPPRAAVELYRVAGGGHTWPGSPVSAKLAPITGRTTFSISADATMWRFFEAHPLTGRLR